MRHTRPFLLLFFLLPLLALQCHKDKENFLPLSADHFIFGRITEFAPQENDVVRLYLLQDGQLYADAMKRPDDSLAFQPVPMSEEAFQLAIRAWTDFPPFLWNQPNTVHGCPNCVDQGTLVVMAGKDVQTFRWDIDPQEWALPEELRPYASLLKEILDGLH